MAQPRDSNFVTRRLAVAAILGLQLASPGTFATNAGCEAHAVRAQESIPTERLANWEPIDDHDLLVWTLHDSRAHLVELDHPVPGLLSASTVFLRTPNQDQNACACGHDEVIVPGSGAARIISIRYLSEKRTAELDAGVTGVSQAGMTLT